MTIPDPVYEKDLTAATTLTEDDYFRILKSVAGILTSKNLSTPDFLTWLTAQGIGGGSDDGWIEATGTWSYSSADSPIFVASIPDADAALMNVGDRIKLTQTTVKYFIIHAKGSPSGGYTPVTVYGGTDYTLANAAITTPYWSHAKSPVGFPMAEDKWSYVYTDSTDRSIANTQNTWKEPTSLPSITVYLGAWKVSYDASADCYSGWMDLTISNTTNSEAYSQLTSHNYIVTNGIPFLFVKNSFLSVAAKTTCHVLLRSAAAAGNLYLENLHSPIYIRFVDAYL